MSKKFFLILAIFCATVMGLQSASAATLAPTTGEYAYPAEITQTSFLPPTIHAGDAISMALDIHNKSSTYSITELNGILEIGNQFEEIDLNDSIALIPAGSTKTLVLKFRAKEDTLPGYYPIFLTMNYLRNNESIKQTENILVPVSKTEKNIDVTISPSVINPGNQTKVVFSLENVGGIPVSNISFSWEEASNLLLPVGSDNKRYVSILDSNQKADIDYTLAADPNITPGIYPLTITMTFNDVNGTKTQTSTVGLIVGGKTDFEVSAEQLSSGQISVSIANIGSNNAGAVVAKIPQQTGIRISGSTTAILGNLNKGDYTIANFQMQTTALTNTVPSATTDAASNAFRQRTGAANIPADQNQGFFANTNPQSLTIQIDYTDTTGERQSIQKTIQLSASSSTALSNFSGRQSNNAFSFVPWILLAAIVAGAVLINKFKAKKSWKTLSIILVIIAILFLAVIFFLNSNLLYSVIIAIVSIVLLAWFFHKKWFYSIKQKLFNRGKQKE